MASLNSVWPAQRNVVASERRFFLGMAIAIAVTVIFGFTLNAARMNWTFLELPGQVHLHAAAFLAWIILYVVQNWLIVRGSVTRHRQLGVLGAVIATSMVVLGIVTTVAAIQQHRVPPFFPPGIFLVLDVLGVIGFGMLTAWAIALRKQAAELSESGALELAATSAGLADLVERKAPAEAVRRLRAAGLSRRAEWLDRLSALVLPN